MAPEGPGGREFTKLVANHLVIDQDGHMLASIVNGYRQSNHVRQDHGTSRPGLDWALVIGCDSFAHLLHEMVIDERSFSNRTWHSSTCYLLERLRTMNLLVRLFLRVL